MRGKEKDPGFFAAAALNDTGTVWGGDAARRLLLFCKRRDASRGAGRAKNTDAES